MSVLPKKIKDEDMPEHETKHLFDLYKNGYNQAIDECTVNLVKAMSVEKLVKVADVALGYYGIGTKMTSAEIDKVFTAIRTAVLGKEEL